MRFALQTPSQLRFVKPIIVPKIAALTLAFGSGSSAKNEEEQQPMEETFISCCFSFTIRRDKWGIPSMIVGNFIQC
jgi:hypothetical protein